MNTFNLSIVINLNHLRSGLWKGGMKFLQDIIGFVEKGCSFALGLAFL